MKNESFQKWSGGDMKIGTNQAGEKDNLVGIELIPFWCVLFDPQLSALVPRVSPWGFGAL